MSITLKKIALHEHPIQEPGPAINPNYLSVVGNITVQLSVRIGTLNLTIGELRQLKIGQSLVLSQKTDEPIALVLNDQIIAQGELMSHEDQFALRITTVST